MSLFARGGDARLQQELDEARRAKDVAEREAQRLRMAIEAAPVGLVIADARGNEVLRNGAVALGGHGDVLLKAAADRLIACALRGEAAEERVTLFGPPMRVLNVRAVPLPDGGALATVDDLSERARLDTVRTDFVSNISHELKTPVGALALRPPNSVPSAGVPGRVNGLRSLCSRNLV